MLNNASEINEIKGVWGRVYHETITINENSVTNFEQVVSLFSEQRKDKSGVIIAIRRRNDVSPSPAYNEVAGICKINATSTKGVRYRNGWSTCLIGSAYDAYISSGSVFDVILMEYTNL